MVGEALRGSSKLPEGRGRDRRRGARARRAVARPPQSAGRAARRSARPAPAPRARPTRRRGRGDHDRSARRRLHGGRAEVARLRVRRLEPRLELPRHPRVDHQLRRQPEAGVPDLLPRGVVGGDGARLLQGRGQADGGAVPRHGGPAARVDGDLQRLLRPRAGVHPGRQHARRDDAAAGRRVGAQRAGRGGDGPRLRQVGRQAGVAAALRRVGGARLQDRDDAADDAGAGRDRRRAAGGSDSAGGRLAAARAAADRWRRRRRAIPAPWPKRRACWSTRRTR